MRGWLEVESSRYAFGVFVTLSVDHMQLSSKSPTHVSTMLGKHLLQARSFNTAMQQNPAT